MSLANLKVDENAQGEVDRLSSGGIVDSDIYLATVKLAYTRKAKSGALGLNLHLDLDNGFTYREELWITSGDKKGNLTYSVDADGNRKNLPGFNFANSLCLLTLGKELQEMAEETKVVKLYDFDQKKEVDTEVPMLVDLLGQEIYVAIEKQVVDKQAKGADGNYHNTGETRENNEIQKFFRASDKRTTFEIVNEIEEAAHFDGWLEKHKGKVRNRSKGAAASAGQAGAPSAGGAPAASGKKSLFG